MAHLLPYQKIGAQFLAGKKLAILADQMGLGKTAQAIAACDSLSLRRVLVICPAIARINWQREFARFAIYDRKFVIVDSKDAVSSQSESLIMSYERAVILHEAGWFKEQKFDALILDESHYLKNPFAKRTKALLGKEGLHQCAARVWALTGTPVTKDVGDLWTFLFTFGATKHNYLQFLNYYCVTEYNPKQCWLPRVVNIKPHLVANLRAILERVCLRRTVEQVLPELPEVTREDVTVERGEVEFSPEDRAKAEEELEALGLMVGPNGEIPMNVLELMAPSSSTLRRYLGLQKIAPAIAILREEIENYEHKIVVFCHHKSVCRALAAAFPTQAVVLTGDTPLEARQRAIDAFQNPKSSVRIFVASISAAGTAITLTAAHHVIFIEQSWIPSDNDQAVGRCRRMGQKYPVHVRTLTVANSIDEAISRVLRRRHSQISKVIS